MHFIEYDHIGVIDKIKIANCTLVCTCCYFSYLFTLTKICAYSIYGNAIFYYPVDILLYKDNPWYKKQDIERTIMIPCLGRSFCTFKCYLCFTSASTVYYRASIAICCPGINGINLILRKFKWEF